MRKVRNYQLLIIAVALIILNIFLPRTATTIIDSLSAQTVSYADLHVDALSLPDVETTSTMPIVNKLVLVLSGNPISVDADASLNLTQDEAVAFAKANLKQYMDCGLFYEMPHIVNYVRPYLMVDYRDRETYCIIWAISLFGPDNTSLDLVIDDETGLILCMDYHSRIRNYNESTTNSYKKLEELSKIYFDSLGISNPIQQSVNSDVDLVYKVTTKDSDYLLVSFSQYVSEYELEYGFTIDLF